jgi:predicted ATPase
VGPLALDVDVDNASTADLARAPAVRLFVERARDVQADFRLTPANGSTAAAICRRLDALPLALELAAPWIKVLTAEDLLRRLTHDVLLSPIGARDLPERQQTINATVAWSYQLLAPNEQRLFRRLGVLPGRFWIEAAVAVVAGREPASATSDDVLGAAAGLIDKSLLLRAAAAAILKGDDQWAARILGARDAVTDRTGATVVDRIVADLNQHAERLDARVFEPVGCRGGSRRRRSRFRCTCVSQSFPTFTEISRRWRQSSTI